MTYEMPLNQILMRVYRELRSRFGPRHWWPAETPFEVCVGAVLTQNTSWKNVSRAIENLKAAHVLELPPLYQMPTSQLAELIRSAGYYNVKATRLMNFVNHVMENYAGDLTSLFSRHTEALRLELLAINGIGKETADSIILYAAQKPVFVVDTYTKRVLSRHGLISERADYDSIQDLFHENLPHETTLFNDFHAQFVAVGNHYCRKTSQCGDCPLESFPVRKNPD